jgi:glucose-6-phosphate isomerase
MEYNKNFYQIHSNDDIFQRIQNERETIGYYDLPYQDTYLSQPKCVNT